VDVGGKEGEALGAIEARETLPDWSALSELAKYVCKSVSPKRAEWIGGEGRTVLHPTLAAAWTMATRRLQLQRWYGVVRGCLSDDPPGESHWQDCPECGHDLGSTMTWELARTAELAVLARSRWRKSLAVVKLGA
jgi:hypothetical protein